MSRVYIKNRYEKNPGNTMRVTRPSRWGNPYKLTDYTREESLKKYELWLKMQITKNSKFLDPLRGKNLACTCKPSEKCHVDILLKHIKLTVCPVCGGKLKDGIKIGSTIMEDGYGEIELKSIILFCPNCPEMFSVKDILEGK